MLSPVLSFLYGAILCTVYENVYCICVHVASHLYGSGSHNKSAQAHKVDDDGCVFCFHFYTAAFSLPTLMHV